MIRQVINGKVSGLASSLSSVCRDLCSEYEVWRRATSLQTNVKQTFGFLQVRYYSSLWNSDYYMYKLVRNFQMCI